MADMHLSQHSPMHADMCPRCTHALNQWRDRHVPPVSLHLLQVRDHCHTSHFCLLRAGTRPALTSHSISKSTPNVVSLPRPRVESSRDNQFLFENRWVEVMNPRQHLGKTSRGARRKIWEMGEGRAEEGPWTEGAWPRRGHTCSQPAS